MTCPQCGQAAEFHSHRTHAPSSLVGPIRHSRAYYLCRRCGEGLFPFDREAGLTTRNLTPAPERVATLAGTVADRFDCLQVSRIHEVGRSRPHRASTSAQRPPTHHDPIQEGPCSVGT